MKEVSKEGVFAVAAAALLLLSCSGPSSGTMCQADGDCGSDSYCYQPFGYCILKADPLVGPEVPGQSFSACGGQSQSPGYLLHSATGQPTPVGGGASTSANFVLLPGVLGGM